jgi:electron transfer flavoprotein alpha subunit
MSVLVVVEHDRGVMAPASAEALAAGRQLVAGVSDLEALTIGADADGIAAALGSFGVATVHQAHHDMLADYGPEAWGAVVAHAIEQLTPAAVLATGTDRGHEVLAHASARLDLPMVANCTAIIPGEAWTVTRVRWGGSLLEEATVRAPVVLITTALHAYDGEQAPESTAPPAVRELSPDIDPELARTTITDRVEREAGITLATAPVVVGGGRGVGSADAFAALEELAGLLGGVVGCSRVATNNGWRNHSDQVGQTGTRIAPTVYLACGISGAIQHWVGAMAAKNIIAVNLDPEANMVTKAGYAVIGDLHEVIPAISAEIRRRRP